MKLDGHSSRMMSGVDSSVDYLPLRASPGSKGRSPPHLDPGDQMEVDGEAGDGRDASSRSRSRTPTIPFGNVQLQMTALNAAGTSGSSIPKAYVSTSPPLRSPSQPSYHLDPPTKPRRVRSRTSTSTIIASPPSSVPAEEDEQDADDEDDDLGKKGSRGKMKGSNRSVRRSARVQESLSISHQIHGRPAPINIAVAASGSRKRRRKVEEDESSTVGVGGAGVLSGFPASGMAMMSRAGRPIEDDRVMKRMKPNPIARSAGRGGYKGTG